MSLSLRAIFGVLRTAADKSTWLDRGLSRREIIKVLGALQMEMQMILHFQIRTFLYIGSWLGRVRTLYSGLKSLKEVFEIYLLQAHGTFLQRSRVS